MKHKIARLISRRSPRYCNHHLVVIPIGSRTQLQRALMGLGFVAGLMLLSSCASRNIALSSEDRSSLKRLGLVLTESMPEANDGPYTIEQAPNSGPVIRIGLRTFSESDVQEINQRAAAKAESILKQAYAGGNRPFRNMLTRVSELNGDKAAISLEDLGEDAAARWGAANTISNGLQAIRPMLEAKNCEGILHVFAYHFAGLEQFNAVPRAYAGIQVRIISALPKDKNRVVLYQKFFFSKHEPVDAPDFANLYVKGLEKLVTDAARQIHKDVFLK